eukprot:7652758-Pyramimonas_sp.AAC.1
MSGTAFYWSTTPPLWRSHRDYMQGALTCRRQRRRRTSHGPSFLRRKRDHSASGRRLPATARHPGERMAPKRAQRQRRPQAVQGQRQREREKRNSPGQGPHNPPPRALHRHQRPRQRL